jgi:hypothetical protein
MSQVEDYSASPTSGGGTLRKSNAVWWEETGAAQIGL